MKDIKKWNNMTSYHGESATILYLCGSCPDYQTLRAERELEMLTGAIKKRIEQ